MNGNEWLKYSLNSIPQDPSTKDAPKSHTSVGGKYKIKCTLCEKVFRAPNRFKRFCIDCKQTTKYKEAELWF